MPRTSTLYDTIRGETYFSKDEIRRLITDDYIRGLTESGGCFSNMRNNHGEQVPAFMLKMHVRDKELIEAIRDYLRLPDRVHDYKHRGRHYVLFQVRNIGALKNKIIPLFRDKLLGYKGTQFKAWLARYPYLRGTIQSK